MSTDSAVLSSWKEIAAYLGKGVRTVQRWERELNLPVRRPVAHNQRIVIAVPSELDAWVRRQVPRAALVGRERASARVAEMNAQLAKLMETMRQVEVSTRQLISTARRRTPQEPDETPGLGTRKTRS